MRSGAQHDLLSLPSTIPTHGVNLGVDNDQSRDRNHEEDATEVRNDEEIENDETLSDKDILPSYRELVADICVHEDEEAQ